MGLREDKREAAWHAIRDAAWGLFDERGYDAVSVEEVAESAGVSRTTFFNYFGAKEGVVLDPSPGEVRRLADLTAEQGPDVAPWPALTTVLLGLTRAAPDELARRRSLTVDRADLAHRGRDLADELGGALREWMLTRLPDDPLGACLVVDVALGAVGTAWAAWPRDAPASTYVDLLETCLDRAAPGWAQTGYPGS